MSLIPMEPKKPEEFIEDAAQVVSYYGYWPSFHDSRIVSLLIEPEKGTITVTFDYNDLTDDDTKSGSSRITLRWNKVMTYSLTADYTAYWMDQLWGVDFVQQEDMIETKIVPTDGIHGAIRSEAVQVMQFDILKDNYEKSNTASD